MKKTLKRKKKHVSFHRIAKTKLKGKHLSSKLRKAKKSAFHRHKVKHMHSKSRHVSTLTTVNSFLKNKVRKDQKPVIETIRKLMKINAPHAKEVILYGLPAWKGKKLLAIVNPSKKHVTFAFARGIEFEDKYGILEGVGNVSRHIKIKTIKDTDKTVLSYYIKQAVKLDK